MFGHLSTSCVAENIKQINVIGKIGRSEAQQSSNTEVDTLVDEIDENCDVTPQMNTIKTVENDNPSCSEVEEESMKKEPTIQVMKTKTRDNSDREGAISLTKLANLTKDEFNDWIERIKEINNDKATREASDSTPERQN